MRLKVHHVEFGLANALPSRPVVIRHYRTDKLVEKLPRCEENFTSLQAPLSKPYLAIKLT